MSLLLEESVTDIADFRGSFTDPAVSKLLRDALGNNAFETYLDKLHTPQSFVSIRVNVTKISIPDALKALKLALRPYRDRIELTGRELAPIVRHAYLPEVIIIPVVSAFPLDVPRPLGGATSESALDQGEIAVYNGVEKAILVDRLCGEAVVSGSDIFVRGVLAASSGISYGDTVRILVDLTGGHFPRGITLEHYFKPMPAGLGVGAATTDTGGTTSVYAYAYKDRRCLLVGLGQMEVSRAALFREERGIGCRVTRLRGVGESPPLHLLPSSCDEIEKTLAMATTTTATSITTTTATASSGRGACSTDSGKGLFYPQSLPSVVVSRVLDPRCGDRVIDICGGPGGKFTHLLQLMLEDARRKATSTETSHSNDNDSNSDNTDGATATGGATGGFIVGCDRSRRKVELMAQLVEDMFITDSNNNSNNNSSSDNKLSGSHTMPAAPGAKGKTRTARTKARKSATTTTTNVDVVSNPLATIPCGSSSGGSSSGVGVCVVQCDGGSLLQSLEESVDKDTGGRRFTSPVDILAKTKQLTPSTLPPSAPAPPAAPQKQKGQQKQQKQQQQQQPSPMPSSMPLVVPRYKSPKFSPETFDRVLLDPPCSALGLRPRLLLSNNTTNTNSTTNANSKDSGSDSSSSSGGGGSSNKEGVSSGVGTNEDGISYKSLEGCQKMQRRLIWAALMLLKPGGTLVYSTCTIDPLENEANVAHILHTYPHAVKLVPVSITVSANAAAAAAGDGGNAGGGGASRTVAVGSNGVSGYGLGGFELAKVARFNVSNGGGGGGIGDTATLSESMDQGCGFFIAKFIKTRSLLYDTTTTTTTLNKWISTTSSDGSSTTKPTTHTKGNDKATDAGGDGGEEGKLIGEGKKNANEEDEQQYEQQQQQQGNKRKRERPRKRSGGLGDGDGHGRLDDSDDDDARASAGVGVGIDLPPTPSPPKQRQRQRQRKRQNNGKTSDDAGSASTSTSSSTSNCLVM